MYLNEYLYPHFLSGVIVSVLPYSTNNCKNGSRERSNQTIKSNLLCWVHIIKE